MKYGSKRRSELLWPSLVVRKLLNISAKDSDYSADTDFDNDCVDDGDSSDSASASDISETDPQSRFGDALPRRRKSETFRAQYINTKDVRICVGTWNVGGELPPDDLDIDDWIDTDEPADIYVFGLQEIVPLNAGNIFGAEDNRPAQKWENIIRDTLNRLRPARAKVKCHSDPPSPSKFKPYDEMADIEEEIMLDSDSDIGEEIHPLDEVSETFDEVNYAPSTDGKFKTSAVPDGTDSDKVSATIERDLQRQFSSRKRLDRLNCLREEDSAGEAPAVTGRLTKMLSGSERVGLSWPEPPLDLLSQRLLQRPTSFKTVKSFKATKSFGGYNSFREEDSAGEAPAVTGRLTKMLSGSERVGLSWPEPPLDLLSQRLLQRPTSFKTVKSFKATKSFGGYNSFKSVSSELQSAQALFAELNFEALMKMKRSPSYMRIVSKQMVGIFLTIWVRRSLRKHIQNIKVSTVGVGVMGYIGNKGSVSVSMSIHQTFFCFVCTHLTSGEKEGDELKRNADVNEIHRRTQFHAVSGVGFPKSIYDHEKIIWLGDLNYRINLPYERTRQLISKKEWSKLVEMDQLARQIRKGRVFDGWSEGILAFPPTYKYEMNSEKYHGDDPKAGRRNPAWCDRILSYGKGMRLLDYRRTELKLSDHRPVTATYMAEVEVFCHKKLQRALTFTDAEIENQEIMEDMGIQLA